MFRKLCLTIILTSALAACGGNAATPAPTAQQNSAPTTSVDVTPTDNSPTDSPLPDITQLPQAGTIIAPATEDPSAGQLYDTVSLNRNGGLAGQELNVVLTRDGTVTRDGAKSTIPADQVKKISDMLDKIGFFGMQGVFQGAAPNPDVYTYNLTAERSGSSRTVTAQDGYVPQELGVLIQALSQLGAAPSS